MKGRNGTQRISEWQQLCCACPDLLFYKNVLELVLEACEETLTEAEPEELDFIPRTPRIWGNELGGHDEDWWTREQLSVPSIYTESVIESRVVD